MEGNEIKISIERAEALTHIRGLGAHKSIGYLPLDSMRNYFGISVDDEIKIAKEKGLIPLLLNREECSIGLEGALYVYNPIFVKELIKENKAIIEKYRWPTDADAFVRRVAYEWIGKTTSPDLFSVIEKAFGDEK